MMSMNPGLDRINNKQSVLHDLVFQHNTAIPAASSPCWNSIYFSTGSMKLPLANLTDNLWLLDNNMGRQLIGDYGLQGTNALTQYMGSSVPLAPSFVGNVMFVPPGENVQTFPLHNYASPVPFTYVAPQYGNYHLTSPYWTDTVDGKLAGIN